MNQLLTPALMNRLARLTLTTKQTLVTGHKGEHRSQKHGTSLEFSDFRIYHLGDDLRQIDWNTYARTNKYYIKRFTDERELPVTLFLDTTRSMFFESKKWEFVLRISAALGYMTLNQNDKFRFLPVSEKQERKYPYFKGKGSIRKLFQELSQLQADHNSSSFATALKKTVKSNNITQGISVVVSDFLEPVAPLLEALKQLQARKQQVLLIQILLPEEAKPMYTGDLKLVDSEINAEKDVSFSKAVMVSYDEKLSEHQRRISSFARKRGMAFVTCITSEKLEEIIFHKLTGTGFLHVKNA